jgi:peptidoglycan/LPS O-acetylase OafA/YrhL
MISKMNYRKDIDGLRAIAILPVIFFHAGFNLFSGGFVGVDVFFVISGFLITSIIVKEIESNKFSFYKFYIRRFRRLFPVGFFIIFVTVVLYAFLYPEHLFIKTVLSALAALLFVSNMYFWQQGGYFENDLHLQPLLHTWSLSVEEQFYLIFPAILVAIFTFKILFNFRYVLICISIAISIALAVIYAPSLESFIGFYVLPTRFYELAIGALVALFLNNKKEKNPSQRFFLREIGFVLIFGTVFGFDSNTAFPSYNALIPVCGTALIILDSSSRGFLFKLLCSKLFVYIGLISYSLYLWHWPLLVAHKWIFGDDVNIFTTFSTILMMFLFAHLSFRFIETPFRNKQYITDRQIMVFSASGFSFLILGCLALLLTGNRSIYDPDGKFTAVYEEAVEPEPYRDKCFDTVTSSGSLDVCTLSSNLQSSKGKILLWGDSHGSALIPAFDILAKSHNVDAVNNSGCPPLFSIIRNASKSKCNKVNAELEKHLKSNHYHSIFLVGAWNNYINWNMISTIESDEPAKSMELAISQTLNYFKQQNTNLVFVAQPPRFKKSQAIEYIRAAALHYDIPRLNISIEEFNKQRKEANNAVKKSGIRSADFTDFFCNADLCFAMQKDIIMYKDTHHISNNAARLLAERLEEFINEH